MIRPPHENRLALASQLNVRATTLCHQLRECALVFSCFSPVFVVKASTLYMFHCILDDTYKVLRRVWFIHYVIYSLQEERAHLLPGQKGTQDEQMISVRQGQRDQFL